MSEVWIDNALFIEPFLYVFLQSIEGIFEVYLVPSRIFLPRNESHQMHYES